MYTRTRSGTVVRKSIRGDMMIEIKGDLFKEECDAFCITTNGFIKSNGTCVMGRGCAKEAASKWLELPGRLGDLIKKMGNMVHPVYTIYPGQDIKNPNQTSLKILLSFPVKPRSVVYNGTNCVRHMKHRFNVGDTIPGWAAKADIGIILRSAKQLVKMTNYYRWPKVVLPRPGCGAGELDWNYVRSTLEQILDNRFYIITY